jgi:hypothetical protein
MGDPSMDSLQGPSKDTGVRERGSMTFAEWALAETDRLIQVRQATVTPVERERVELQITMLYGAADRYGRNLVEMSDL